MSHKIPHIDKQRFIKSILVFFIIFILVFSLGFLFGIDCGKNKQLQTESENLDEYFTILYNSEIYPEGEKEIENFITSLSPSLNETERFEKIAEWVTSDFHDKYWETNPNYLNNSDFHFVRILPSYEGYAYDPEGRIRVLAASPFSSDPAWIAYYRTGACGDIATLFANIVNRTGNPTKIIVVVYENQVDNHAWVEITRKNGDIFCFDPTLFGEYTLFGTKECANYSGDPSTFTIPWDVKIEGVYDTTSKIDITDKYPTLKEKMKENSSMESIINYLNLG